MTGEAEKFSDEPKKVQREFHYRDGLLTKLYDTGQFETLARFQRGEIEIQEIIAADKQGRLGSVGQDIVAYRPLWRTWEDLIPVMRVDRGGPIKPETRRNYLGSMKRLKKLDAPGLGEDAVILDLKNVDWHRLVDAWEDSAAAWNHIGRALSRFLTVALGDKFHPIRREVVKRFPHLKEYARVPTLTRMQFYRILDMLPERWRPYFVVLAVTGLRIGELCALTLEHIDHEAKSIKIEDSKTEAGWRTIFVDDEFWPYVMAAVPVPVTHWYLRDMWNGAVDRAGLKDVRVHDLRHFAAQLLSDNGSSEATIQAQLGHADPGVTRKYSMQTARKETAAKMVTIFPGLRLDEDAKRKLVVRAVP